MQTAITVSEALDRLRAFHPFSVQRAINYLSDQSECIQVLRWYQHYFPQDYANSKAAVGTVGYCAREMEFFELLNERLFPIDRWVLEDYSDEEGYRYAYIPVEPLGYAPAEDDEFNELQLSIQVLILLLRGAGDTAYWDEILPKISPNTPCPQPAKVQPGVYQLNWDIFSQLCQQAEGLIADVPVTMDVLSHNTGNFWLDIGYDDMYPIEWSRENIDGLADEYRLAAPLIEKFNRVADELSAHPDGLAQVITLWNLSLERPQKKGR